MSDNKQCPYCPETKPNHRLLKHIVNHHRQKFLMDDGIEAYLHSMLEKRQCTHTSCRLGEDRQTFHLCFGTDTALTSPVWADKHISEKKGGCLDAHLLKVRTLLDECRRFKGHRDAAAVLIEGEVLQFTLKGIVHECRYVDGQFVRVDDESKIFASPSSFCKDAAGYDANGWICCRALRNGIWTRLSELEPLPPPPPTLRIKRSADESAKPKSLSLLASLLDDSEDENEYKKPSTSRIASLLLDDDDSEEEEEEKKSTVTASISVDRTYTDLALQNAELRRRLEIAELKIKEQDRRLSAAETLNAELRQRLITLERLMLGQ